MLSEFYFLITLVVISGLFSSSESALFSLSVSQKNQLKLNQHQKKKNKQILEWLRQPEKTLSAILFGNLITNIFISELGHGLVSTHTNFSYVHKGLIALIGITLMLLIFSEVIPKLLALQTPMRWSLGVYSFLRVWFFLSRYIAQPVQHLMRHITSRLPTPENKYTEKELIHSIALASSDHLIQEHEKNILKRSVIFHHDVVFQSMIPRSRVFMVPHNISSLRLKKAFLEKGCDFSIVYHASKKKLLGYLHIRNLILLIHKKSKSITSKLQNILFLPQTMPLDQALKDMIQEKTQVAAIVDESGEFSGVLTLKALLAKLIGGGEEKKEFEPNSDQLIKKIDHQVFRVKGSMTINQFNDFFNTNLEHDEIETISGYIINRLDGFPKNAVSFQIDHLYIYDIKLQDHTLTSFLVRVFNVH